MISNLFIEASCKQIYCNGERVCGDVFHTVNVKEEGRRIIVLSDGMGHGVKANILGILTATMAARFTVEHKETNQIAETILNTLPIDSEKKTSFSTFTVVDVEADGKTTILEYENPQCLVLRGDKVFQPEWNCLVLNTKKTVGREIMCCTFQAQQDDRIVMFSDGVTQSGMGSKALPLGWGTESVHQFIQAQVTKDMEIDASQLGNEVVSSALRYDGFESKDDISCAVVYFRKPRKMLVCTGPPVEMELDKDMAKIFEEFEGKKVICGGSTSELIFRELKIDTSKLIEEEDSHNPPYYLLPGIEIITEGVVTLNAVYNTLNKMPLQNEGTIKGAAGILANLLIESDDIKFLVGTKINQAHQSPDVPIDLEMRRTVVHRIARVLEQKYLKTVEMSFM